MAVKFRAGQQLVSAVDSTAVIVIRAPAGECTLTCGGVAMAAPGEVAHGLHLLRLLRETSHPAFSARTKLS